MYTDLSHFYYNHILATGRMDNREPLDLTAPLPRKFTKWIERTPFHQIVTRVMHSMVEKGCRKACQLFCCPLDYEKLPSSAGESAPSPVGQMTPAFLSPPPTLLIVNISNSTLNNCVIGKDIYPPLVTQGQPVTQKPELQACDQVRCSCSQGQQGEAQTIPPPPSPPPFTTPPQPSIEPKTVNVLSSDLKWVIIGDNNSMWSEQTVLANELQE